MSMTYRQIVHWVYFIFCWRHNMSNSNLNELNENANVQVNDLYQLFCSNNLTLNSKKTKYIWLRPIHRREDLSRYSIKIGNIELDRIGNNCKEHCTILYYAPQTCAIIIQPRDCILHWFIHIYPLVLRYGVTFFMNVNLSCYLQN